MKVFACFRNLCLIRIFIFAGFVNFFLLVPVQGNLNFVRKSFKGLTFYRSGYIPRRHAGAAYSLL